MLSAASNLANRMNSSFTSDDHGRGNRLPLDDTWVIPRYHPSSKMSFYQIGKVDPSLYSDENSEEFYEYGPDHIGRLWFTADYSGDLEQLKVTILKARNLRFKREMQPTGQAGDCFVRVYLESDERRNQSTATKRKTQHPVFNENLYFQIAEGSLGRQKLKIIAVAVDKHRKQRTIGWTSYELHTLTSTRNELRISKDLLADNSSENENVPELKIGLYCSDKVDRINVNLVECRNVPSKYDDELDMYLKVSLHHGLNCKELKLKRTGCIVDGPIHNESFTFSHLPQDSDQLSLRITFCSKSGILGNLFDKQLYFLSFGSDMFSKRTELAHWEKMLTNSDQPVVMWHHMQECV